MNSMVIDFTSDGTAQAQHRDGFPLGFLGKQEIERASEIVFNDETQQWDIHVRIPGGGFALHSAAMSFAGYDIARKVETRWLDECRSQDITDPISGPGIRALLAVRKALENSDGK